ncbi:MAG: type B DNA-directed DNA polymerase [Halobacteriota archaeon]
MTTAPFALDFRGGDVVEWYREDGAVWTRRVREYTPTIYVSGPASARRALRTRLDEHPHVAATAAERWYTELGADERETVLRADVTDVDHVGAVAGAIRRVGRNRHAPGAVRLFNVDLAPGFRYCVETETRPSADPDLRRFSVGADEKSLADRRFEELDVDGDTVGGEERSVIETLAGRLHEADPDVLVVSHGDLVPAVASRAAALGVDFQWGRRPGWERLADHSTVESYGQVGHSPARYDVPGRILLDRSRSFLWGRSGMAGLASLVEHSWRPIQETAWASIGTVLTSIQIRQALDRDVLAPWNKWNPEAFKDVRTLHAADRGGITLEPVVGRYEDVWELDFASLYPNVIRRHNVSPETVCCDCHDRADVPELGYSICDGPGFLPAVLTPLLDDRAACKRALGETTDPTRKRRLEEISEAIKWVLVSCFGYQGYRNAKFGRIECHEAINAIARDLLLRAKETIEAGGWRVVHGIVDSLWVQPRPGAAQTPLSKIAARVTDDVGIRLEIESRYEWVCFVPKRGSNAGALTKYFGKKANGRGDAEQNAADGDEADGAQSYKVRGIELRQRSTPAYVAGVQRDLVQTLDRRPDPEAVCERLRCHLRDLRAGEVSTADLVVRTRASKSPSAYHRQILTKAALDRAVDRGLPKHPGQDVRYVVVDVDADGPDRVRLPSEAPTTYDADHYADLLVRAAESVVAPLGWDRRRVRRFLRADRNATLSAFE